MDSPLKLGMSLDEVRAAVGDLEVSRYTDEIGSETTFGQFERDGWEHHVHLEDEVVDHLWASGAVPTFSEAIELIETVVARYGAPGYARTYDDRELFEWEWSAALVSFRLSRETDGTWNARWDHSGRLAGFSPPTITLAAAREVTAAIAGHLAAMPAADGARGAALARWRDQLHAQRERFDHFFDVVGIATPAAPITEFGLPELLRVAGWIARHDEMFPELDDWRDALVIGEVSNDRELRWQVSYANDGETSIRLVEGPFATGILRVHQGIAAEALFPMHDLPLDEIEVTVTKPTYRRDRPEKMKPDTAVASWRGVTVELTGHSSLDRVARAYVAVLAARGAQPPGG